MNFVYDGVGTLAGRTYIGTASHCVREVGEEMADGHGQVFGHVAHVGDISMTETDYALIEVHSDHLRRVDPSVRGHADYPAGITTVAMTRFGDALQMSGYGILTNINDETRQRRRAYLSEHDDAIFNSVAPVGPGDSGGPIVHVATGSALGIVSGYEVLTPGNLNGPTIVGVLKDAAQGGFPVALRLAGQPAPAPPAPPPPAGSPQPSSAPSRPSKRASRGKKARKGSACATGRRAKGRKARAKCRRASRRARARSRRRGR